MRFSTLHYTQWRHGVVLVCLLAGCWQEIEYTGPDPSAVAPPRSPAPAASNESARETSADAAPPIGPTDSDDSTASGFADELAADSPADQPSSTPDSTEAQVDDRSLTPDASSDGQPGTGATTASATIDSDPATRSPNTRRAAWLLGSRLSLAALAHDRGAAADQVPEWISEARAAAETLGTSLVDLPDPPAARDNENVSRQVLNYLFAQGQQVGRDLAARHGADHAALFEVAVKSNILLVLYKPGSSAANAIAAAMAEAAPRAVLPAKLWRPLVDTLANGRPPAEVRAAVRRLHDDVEKYLINAVKTVEQ